MLSQVIVDAVISGAIYSLLAFGFTITYGTLNFFNMAHGVAFTLGAYVCYVFRILVGLDFAVSAGLAIVLTCLVMVLVDLVAYDRLRRRRAPSWAMVVSSIGVAVLIEALISMIFGSDTLSLRVGTAHAGHPILGAVITDSQVTILVVTAVLLALLTAFLKLTRFGKALRAIANDSELGVVIGIAPRVMYMLTFVLASGLAAAAGCLVALETDIYPTMGQGALLKSIIASIIGGVGNVGGAAFGGLFLASAENLGVWKISSSWQDCIALGLMLVFMLGQRSRNLLLGK